MNLAAISGHTASDLGSIDAVRFATEGLINYRAGDLERGRVLYTKAIEIAKRASDKRIAAKAALFFALEEVRAEADYSNAASQAFQLSSEFVSADFELLRNRLKREIKHHPKR